MKSQQTIWDEEYNLNKNKWKKDTLKLPLIMKDKAVLELGVGNGKTLRAILRQHPKKVAGVDFSTKAIEICRKSFSDEKVVFKKADVKNIPFNNKEFDIIVCYYILNNLSRAEIKKALSEIKRVLKNNGKIIFKDFATGDFREKGIIRNHTIKNKKGIVCHFFTSAEVKSLFKDFSKANFKIKTSYPITHKPNLRRKTISGIITK